jgi:hypothetical protein
MARESTVSVGGERDLRFRGAVNVSARNRAVGLVRPAWRGCGWLVLTILAVVLCGACKKKQKRQGDHKKLKISQLAEVASPLDTGISANSKQRFINVTRYRLNLALGDDHKGSKWDLWAEGSSRFVLPDGRKAFLVSFRRVLGADRQRGLLIIGRMEGDMPAVLGQWTLPASIDDMHVVDLALPVGKLLHTVSMARGKQFNTLYQHLLRFQDGRLETVWSVRGGYKTETPSTYSPPVIRFADVDDNGEKEVLVRVPGPKAPKLWKHRWAEFDWNSYKGRFLPKKGLAWSQIAVQKPIWAVFGFLEALEADQRDKARRFLLQKRGCQHPDDLLYAFAPKRWKRSGRLNLETPDRKDIHQATAAMVTVPLRKPSVLGRYEAQVTLIGRHPNLSVWKICRVKFLKW